MRKFGNRAWACAAACAVACAGWAEEQAFVKLPPPVYGGLVKDYMQAPYSETNAVILYVRRAADAKLLASARTQNVCGGVNYAVSLPMVSAASDGVLGLRYGEQATFSFLDGDVMWANLVTVTVDKPGYRRLDATLAHDENGDGIADEYVAYLAFLMREYGIAGNYDPDADYNRDGVTNRVHYLAGTNPFAGLTVGGATVGESACTISSLMNVRSYAGDEYFALTFNALEEMSYAVLALDDLSKGWGAAVCVASREQPDGGDEENEHWAETTGEMTLYVPKGNARQRFYKLVVGSW